MNATLMGMKVDAQFFVIVTIIIIVAQIGVFRFSRRGGLVEGLSVLSTPDRILVSGAMIVLSLLAFAFGFLAFVASFVEQWQILWLIGSSLAVAGMAGLVLAGRLSSR